MKSEARWEGEVEVNNIRTWVAIEVFDSGGKWDFLFGKTLLEAFKAVHNYEMDEIKVSSISGTTTICNQTPLTNKLGAQTNISIHITMEEEPLSEEEHAPAMEINVENLQDNGRLFTL